MVQKLNPIQGNTPLWILGLSLVLVGFFLKPLIRTLQNKGQSHLHIGSKEITGNTSTNLKKVQINISLKGHEFPTDWVETPLGTTYQFEGPDSVEVLFQDGTRGPIWKNYGVKRGIFCFYGPK